MLALERPDALVLVARNIHHSIINAIKAFGLDFRFLPDALRRRAFEAVLPPSVEEVVGGAAALSRGARGRSTRRRPTRGSRANTQAIAAAVHDASPDAMVFVDEAWGGHLHFHPELPP